MLDAQSPLKTVMNPGHFGADGPVGVTLSTRVLSGLWQIAGWSDFEQASAPALAHLGFTGPGDYRNARRNNDVTCWRIAPDRLLFEGSGDLSDFQTEGLVALDLGHAKTVIKVEGSSARVLLSQLVAIDWSETAFPQGMFIQTGIHHVAVLIECIDDDAFEIFVPVTWASSVWQMIFDNALPLGVLVEAKP